MSNYGKLATIAATRARKGANPIAAWKLSAEEVFPNKKASREKGCPKCAFLGLAEEGLIRGVPPGSYTSSKRNKQYALAALATLRENPNLAEDTEKLWAIVIAGEEKQHNEQMSVVAELWQNGDLESAT